MTDKQIIIDVSKCEWRTGVEHCGNYECMLNKCCDYNCDWYKRRKLEQQLKRKEKSEEKLVKQIQTICDFINNRPETFKGINGSVDKIIIDYAERKEQECEEWKLKATSLDYADEICALEIDLKRKEQECESWKALIDEAQIEQRKLEQQLEAYKMEAEEGKEINAELKADNDELKKLLKDGGLHNLSLMAEKRVLLQTLAEIKEIAEDFYLDGEYVKVKYLAQDILQKINEVIDE